jgi:hypothetical protein
VSASAHQGTRARRPYYDVGFRGLTLDAPTIKPAAQAVSQHVGFPVRILNAPPERHNVLALSLEAPLAKAAGQSLDCCPQRASQVEMPLTANAAYRRAGSAESPTCWASHCPSGRLAARNSATTFRAVGVASQGSIGHSFQATRPLCRSNAIRG